MKNKNDNEMKDPKTLCAQWNWSCVSISLTSNNLDSKCLFLDGQLTWNTANLDENNVNEQI